MSEELIHCDLIAPYLSVSSVPSVVESQFGCTDPCLVHCRLPVSVIDRIGIL